MIGIISGGVVAVLVVIQLLVPHFLPALFTTAVRPFWRMEFSIMSGSLSSPSALLAENESLKIKLSELTAQNDSFGLIQTENNELLNLLGRPDATKVTGTSTSSSSLNLFSSSSVGKILAAVLVRPPLAAYDELIIDVGLDKDIQLGAKVYAPGNILIGTTTDILGETAKVNLFSSPGQKYPVLIGASHIPATAIGRGGGQYEAQVPQATAITEGDLVLDSTFSDGIFGKVTKVLNDPAQPFETILFSPQVNLYQIRWVLIDNGAPSIVNVNVKIKK